MTTTATRAVLTASPGASRAESTCPDHPLQQTPVRASAKAQVHEKGLPGRQPARHHHLLLVKPGHLADCLNLRTPERKTRWEGGPYASSGHKRATRARRLRQPPLPLPRCLFRRTDTGARPRNQGSTERLLTPHKYEIQVSARNPNEQNKLRWCTTDKKNI